MATPPILMASDLLELDGEDRKRPLRERRQALEHLLKGERLILPVRRLSSEGPRVAVRAGAHVELSKSADGQPSRRRKTGYSGRVLALPVRRSALCRSTTM